MKQFTQLLVLILILSGHFSLSASNFHRNDTIGKFNEITDIEIQFGTKSIIQMEKNKLQSRMLLKSYPILT